MSAIAIITSDYINGISIWNSLKKLQFQGDVVFLNASGRNMVGSIWPGVQVIDFVKRDPADIMEIIHNYGHYDEKFIFLTSELFHNVLYANREELQKLNAIVYFGDSDPMLILDKERFLSHLRNNTSVPVPESYQYGEVIKYPIILKYRRSFNEEERAPKPVVINNKQELDQYLHEKKVSAEDVQLQELLSSEDADNVSICGWYDEEKPVLFRTRKLIQHPPKVGNGDVVEVLERDAQLEQQAIDICKAIKYRGPFEIEFIRELNGNKFKVIEMNPRFWMQHGLVEELSGHYLVAKYIGQQPLAPKQEVKYWIYPMVSIYKTLLMNFKYMPYLFKSRVHWPVNGTGATKFLLKHLLSKF